MEESFVEEQQQESSENLEELEQKRNVINNDAEKHRRLRDDLNKQTKEWAAKRDALNAQVREFVDEAGKRREERDNFNQKVKESKVFRDEWNQKVTKLYEEVSSLRKDIPKEEGVSIKTLKKQLQDLEFRQQTALLGKDEDDKIVKQISILAHEILEKEKNVTQGDDVKEIMQKLRDAKAEAEVHHKAVSEYAEKAQTAHDQMIAAYDNADRLRKEADEAQAKFIESKTNADEEHKKHIEQIKSIHDMDKDFSEAKNKGKAARKKKADTESKKEAKEIFERFKAGDKLSTEDLMALQKSGYL